MFNSRNLTVEIPSLQASFFTHRNFANLFPLFALLSPAGLAERLQESVTNSAEDGGEVGGLKRSGGGKSDGGV